MTQKKDLFGNLYDWFIKRINNPKMITTTYPAHPFVNFFKREFLGEINVFENRMAFLNQFDFKTNSFDLLAVTHETEKRLPNKINSQTTS